MGRLVLVQNCSDGSDARSMARTFMGLVQTGAWGCFDELNRVDVGVLSVVAQQIKCIFQAQSRRATVFIFEGGILSG